MKNVNSYPDKVNAEKFITTSTEYNPVVNSTISVRETLKQKSIERHKRAKAINFRYNKNHNSK
jgi:hypothetical protein